MREHADYPFVRPPPRPPRLCDKFSSIAPREDLPNSHPLNTPPPPQTPMRLNDMTPTRTEINQANSQHSTGPKTAAGKQRSSLNALRHGLTGQLVVMPTEDLYAYQDHVKSFTDEYHPEGATEAQLVQALADTSWRM